MWVLECVVLELAFLVWLHLGGRLFWCCVLSSP